VRKFRRSSHLSFFRKGAQVYLHHDLTGDIVGMDEKLLGFLDFFAVARSEPEARARWKGEFSKDDLDAFFEILPDHCALVLEELDEVRELDDWYPLRGPWILVHAPAAGPLTIGYRDRATERTVLEHPAKLEASAFRLCDGAHSIAEIVKATGDGAREAIFRWTHSERQVLKLIERPASAYADTGYPPYVESTMPYARLRDAGTPPPSDTASTRDYHKDAIVSADEQFEVRETTLSHSFRVPHPALGGESYGARLARALLDRDVLTEKTARVVEVGGGTGLFARCFLDGLAVLSPGLQARVRWTICDLAPELQRSQRERTRPHAVELVRGDAVALPFATGSVDLLLANEMIADLESVQVERSELDRGEGKGAALARRYRLSLGDAPEGPFWLNAGTFAFLSEVSRVLAPGGRAVVTEFGEIDRYPVESTHLDHREFSIHFGHARSAAEACGLEARIESVPDLLELDPSVPVLVTNRSFFQVLRTFLGELGVRLEKIAYTRPMLEELVRGKAALGDLQGLRFEPAGERVLGLHPAEFKALILEKRGAAGARTRKSVEL
jgi:ubiquinone/menaquinone biosynthesis C-methylase UbiE